MRKLFYLVVSIVMFGLIISGCIFHVVPPLGQDGSIDIVKDGVSYKTNLIAGQHTVAGSITVSNDGENLFVTYETVDNWLINETHLYVGTTIPANSAPGKFPYKREELGGVTTDTYAIPLDDLRVGPCNTIYIAAHAELVNGETKETGWAKGVKIEPGKNWAMYFNYQIWPCGSEIPELTEAISQEIDLSIGGTVEVIDPESIINGVKLIIPPIPSEKKGGKLIANITISYIDDPYSLELPDNRGFLLPPVVINSDILFDAECILEIPYTEDDLSNMGLSSNEGIKVYYYNYYSSSWEEVSINKRNYKAEINFEYMLELTLIIEDTNMTYAISTPSFILPLPFDPGFPQPGDLLYRKSNVGGIDGWIPGHVGIYVGEKYGDHDNDPSTPDKAYNVIEALGKFTIIPFKIEGKVEANYYNPITEFADKFNTTYLGARQPDSGALDSEQRSDVLKFLDDKEVVGMPYAGDETKQFLWGLARGDYVKGMFGDYNCVGLAEAAYESVGVDLVSDEYEGNNASDISARAVLTPAEQYNKTEPAEGYTVSGQVTDSQGVKIPDVTLNFELVTFNNNHSDSFDVTTNSNGGWSSDKLGREWKVTPQKDGYTFEPSTKKVKEDANDIDFTGTFMTGSQYQIQWSTAESNGWANPLGEGEELITSTAYDYDSSIYLNNHPGKRHMGIDIISELDENVYSIAYGTIVKLTRDYSATSNQSVVIVKHTNSNNENFFAIYGHVLAREDLGINSKLEAGEKIGVVKKSGSPCHLHFGVNISSEFIDNLLAGNCGWGLISESDNPSYYGWVDPIDYLNTHQTEAVVSNVVAVYWTDHYPSNSQNIEHQINVFWDPYPEASGYKVYRSVNGVAEAEPIYSGSGELLYDKNVVQWHDLSNIEVGNSYSYYVTAYGDSWETAPSQETGTINTFLPPIYLVSPSDGETINNSTPTFEWSPVGVNPGGSINSGITELWVKDLTDDKVTWDILINDMTTSNATYNQDGQASPLILGHSYAWEVTSYGSVDDMEVAISQSEYWEFTFGTVTGSVHNLTKDTYYNTIQEALDDANTGDTIEVDDGTYTENVGIIKDHLTLKSKNGAEKTTIEAADENNNTLLVQADYTYINGFTIEGAGAYYFGDRRGGIRILANYCTILNNIISNNKQGIFISNTNNNTISNNMISNNSIRGILLEAADYNTFLNNIIDSNGGSGIDVHAYYGISGTYYSYNNTIINNTISNNGAGIRIVGGSGNLAYLNNLIDNNTNGSSSSLVTNPWNSPEEITYSYSGTTYTNYLGNYWDDYTGEDADNDGIGDIPYILDEEQDNYPLMEPFENY